MNSVYKSDFMAITAIVAALSSQQEQIEFWLRSGAAAVAIIAGVIAIVQKLFPGLFPIRKKK